MSFKRSGARKRLGTLLSPQVFMFLSRIVGFPISMLLVWRLGTRPEINHFYVLVALSTAVGGLISNTTEIQSVRHLQSETRAHSKTMGISTAWMGLTAAGVTWIAAIALYGLNSTTLTLSCLLTLSIPSNSLQGTANGIFSSVDRWAVPATSNVLRATVVLMFVLCIGHDIVTCALSLAIADATRILFLTIRMWSWDRRVGLSHDKVFLRRTLKLLPGSALSAVNPVADRIIVDRMSLGSVGLLDLAEKSSSILAYIVTLGVIPSLTPRLARDCSRTSIRRMARTVGTVAALCVLGGVTVVVLASHLSGLLQSQHAETWFHLWIAYLPGIVAYSIQQVYVRGLVISGLETHVIWLSTLLLSVNVAADLLLSRVFGIAGVPVASSMTGICGLLAARIMINRHFRITQLQVVE